MYRPSVLNDSKNKISEIHRESLANSGYTTNSRSHIAAKDDVVSLCQIIRTQNARLFSVAHNYFLSSVSTLCPPTAP
jgi:hypothetical protein